MAVPLIQPSFAAGELAPSLHARVDLAKYHVGLATCLNWCIQAQGGAFTRPGSLFVDAVLDNSKRSRLIPFQFNILQAYALEFGDQKMRVVMNGGYVLEAAKNITGITQANPAVVTSNAHGYSNGDEVFITGVVGMTQVNGRRFTVAGAAANTFQLSGIDSSAYTAYSSGGTVARYYTLATPYAIADLPLLKYVQSADTMTLTHGGYAPRNLTRSGHASWTLSTITYAAQIAAPTGVTATPSSVSAAQTYEYVVTAIDAETGEESLPSSVGSCTFKLEFNWNPTTGDQIGVQWNNVTGASTYNIYRKKNGIFGFVGNAADGTVGGFTDNKYEPQTDDTPPTAKNPFPGAGDWPSCVTYHDERQIYAATVNKPQTLFGSVSGVYKNMNVSTPTKDDDAFTRTLVSRQVNEIRHLVSMNVLIALTSGAEWKIWPGTNADVLTPAAFSAKPQSYAGSSHVPPLLVNDSLIFNQEQGATVRDLRYQFDTDGYAGIDLTILSRHMFEGYTIAEWCFAQEPYRLIWAVRSDGVLLTLAYLKEQQVYAWSRHVTDGLYESVCSISESGQNVVYAIVRRTIGGQTKRYVERFQGRMISDVVESWSVDCGLQYDGRNTDGAKFLTIIGSTYLMGELLTLQATGHTPFTSASVGRRYRLRVDSDIVEVTVAAYTDTDTVTARLESNAAASLHNVGTAAWALLATSVTGLSHLEGKSVAILGDGNVFPQTAVSGGAITLESACARIVVGLPYTCDAELLNIDVQGGPTVQSRQKAIGSVTLRLEKSRGLKVGPTALDGFGQAITGTPGKLTEIKERSTQVYGQAVPLFTGDREVLIDPSWNSNGRVFIRQEHPLPATLLAAIPRVSAGD